MLISEACFSLITIDIHGLKYVANKEALSIPVGMFSCDLS